MHPALFALLVVATVAVMEAVAWLVHRYWMHGPGWFLHKSHHEPRKGHLEANDLHGVIFAIPSILLIWAGSNTSWGDPALAVGAGISLYGLIYFLVHDVLVHRRVPHRFVPRSGYLKRLHQAHHLHHAVATREGAVSFGFVWAPRPEVLKAELKRRGREGVRGPVLRDAPTGAPQHERA